MLILFRYLLYRQLGPFTGLPLPLLGGSKGEENKTGGQAFKFTAEPKDTAMRCFIIHLSLIL